MRVQERRFFRARASPLLTAARQSLLGFDGRRASATRRSFLRRRSGSEEALRIPVQSFLGGQVLTGGMAKRKRKKGKKDTGRTIPESANPIRFLIFLVIGLALLVIVWYVGFVRGGY